MHLFKGAQTETVRLPFDISASYESLKLAFMGAKRIQDLPRTNKVDGLLELETELHEIETESQEFGLQLPKRASARMPDPNVGRIEAGVQGADVAVNELKKVQDVNARFIQVLIEELLFVEKVGLGSDRASG